MVNRDFLTKLMRLNAFSKVLWLCLFGVFFQGMIGSSQQHDVHRIVLKTHYRRITDRDVQKIHPNHQQPKKPVLHESFESLDDDWHSLTTKTPRAHVNKNNRRLQQQHKNGNKRGISRSTTTTTTEKPTTSTPEDLTTEMSISISENMSLPIFEETFSKYHQVNSDNNTIIGGQKKLKVKQQQSNVLKTNNNSEKGEIDEQNKLVSNINNNVKGYEVYEEIIGDVSPPPPPRLNIQNIPFFDVQFPIFTPKDEENHIKENISDDTEAIRNKTYGKRTKLRRSRINNVKLE